MILQGRRIRRGPLSSAINVVSLPDRNKEKRGLRTLRNTTLPERFMTDPLLPHIRMTSLSGYNRSFVTRTHPGESATLAAGLLGLAVAAQGAKHATVAYNEWAASKAEDASSEDDGEGSEGGGARKKEKKVNFFDQFGFGGPSKFYEGGFEDEMTRQEAALILGVRESSSTKRIKDAHRTILIANHPDTGGSTFIASKVNEAKELLLKNKE